MKKINKVIIVSIIITSAIFSGCSMMNNNPTNPTNGNFISISPRDNSQDIGINQVVTIQFAAPVDSKTIEGNFVLISEKDISDSTCPVSKNMGHSDMNADMMDTSMMNHLKMTHHTSGTFKWNSDRTKCEFKSDASLSPNTEYMMYIDSDMMNHMKNVIFSNGMLNGVMGMMDCDCMNKGLDKNYIITRFRTKNN